MSEKPKVPCLPTCRWGYDSHACGWTCAAHGPVPREESDYLIGEGPAWEAVARGNLHALGRVPDSPERLERVLALVDEMEAAGEISGGSAKRLRAAAGMPASEVG